MTVSPPQLIQAFPEWNGRIRAAFSTRMGGFSSGLYSELNLGFRSGDDPSVVKKNWDAVRAELGLAGKPLLLPTLVHGNTLLDADALNLAGEWPSGFTADAVFSRTRSAVLAVTMADCLTALIFDPESGTIAAVHAGWRGTNLGILEKTLLKLIADGCIMPKNTLVAFGPCLRPRSMEVGMDVAAQLDPAFVTQRENKFYFDLPECNRSQALKAGISPGNIRDAGGDTLQEAGRYFSFRRDGQNSGRMAAFISFV